MKETTFSTIGFKTKRADLRRKSPIVFAVCLIASILFTGIALHIVLPKREKIEKTVMVAPVILQLDNIPETRHRVTAPAPPRPIINNGIPIEVMDDLIPDDITIEDTTLNIDSPVETAPTLFIPELGDAGDVEREIFEYFAVEEPPKRKTMVAPDYPLMAERAGIEGTVTMKMLINAEGAVDSVFVLDGPKVFHTNSITAARKTTFTPARHNDRSVPCWIILPFRFVLDN